MTRGDFILGVLASLVCAMLCKLASKLHPRLKNISFIQLSKQFLAIVSAQKLPTRILPTTLAFVIAFFILVNISPQSVIAPSNEKKGATAIITYMDSMPPLRGTPIPCPPSEPLPNPDNDPVVEVINSLPEAPCLVVDNSH
jgi:hypothetical protein